MTFTNATRRVDEAIEEAVLTRATRFDSPVMYPPYGRLKRWLMRRAM